MRVSIWAMLAVAAGLMAAPALAQTYDPKFPVCLDVHDTDGSYYECAYYTLEQCNMSASGRAAQCVVNPFYSGGRTPAAPPYPRRRGY